MSWEGKQKALYDWACEYLEMDVVWANQNQPRPSYPFAVLNILDIAEVGEPEVVYCENGDGTLDTAVISSQQFTLSVHVATMSQLPCENARYFLDKLRTSVRLPEVKESLALELITINEVLSMLNIDQIIEGQWESRWALDISFNSRDLVQQKNPTGVIEKVEVTNEIPPAHSYTIP